MRVHEEPVVETANLKQDIWAHGFKASNNRVTLRYVIEELDTMMVDLAGGSDADEQFHVLLVEFGVSAHADEHLSEALGVCNHCDLVHICLFENEFPQCWLVIQTLLVETEAVELFLLLLHIFEKSVLVVHIEKFVPVVTAITGAASIIYPNIIAIAAKSECDGFVAIHHEASTRVDNAMLANDYWLMPVQCCGGNEHFSLRV